jgi:hypothetical protein
MAEEGIEPSRPCGQGILNPQRLPFRHSAGLAQGNPFPAFAVPMLFYGKTAFLQGFNAGKSVFRSGKCIFVEKPGKFA